MKAITYTRYGPPEVLSPGELTRPHASRGEILIRVRAVEVTKADCEMRAFSFPARWSRIPLRLIFGVTRPRRPVLGMYFAGEVADCGEGVEGFAPGDAVFGSTGFRLGAYGQYVAVPARSSIARKPVNMSFAEAAAVPLGGFNALHFLRLAGIEPGESMLINGAGGSIGMHALQIARAMGATVTCVDRADKASRLRSFGAQSVIDYEREDFTALGRRWDVVFDMVYGHSHSASVGVLNEGGRYISANPSLGVMLRSMIFNRFTDKKSIFAFAAEKREELETLVTMIEKGEIVSIVDDVLPMGRAVDAHRRVEAEQRVGAIVLEID